MVNLNEMIQNAHGGQGVDSLAQQFGITPEQAQAAVQAILPGLSHGLQNHASNGGLGDILGHIGNPQNQQAFDSPAAASAGATTNAGGAALGQIFGDPRVAQQVAQHASQYTGLSPDLLQQMMPVIASMVMGGLFKAATNQGLGGLLGQLAGQGNLGAILGQAMGQSQPQGASAAPAQPAPGGGLGGMLGGVLGGLLGGGPGAAPGANRIDPQTVQAGIDALTKMFGHGVQAQPNQQASLQDILSQAFSGRRPS